MNIICLHAQVINRVEADYSVKEIDGEGHQNLMIGKVYFNNVKRQILFDVKFPVNEIIIINDTATIKFNSRIVNKHALPEKLIDFSVFKLVTSNQLEYFGLKQTPFVLTSVTKEDGLVLSDWELPPELMKGVGKMTLAQKDGMLYGLISFSEEGEIISKQFFKKYQNINGFAFPGEVIQISYMGNKEFKRITTYGNIIVNNNDNEGYYNFIFGNISF